MQTIVNTPTIDELVTRLRANKHYCEYKMTPRGFTQGNGHYCDPSELVIVNIYTFRDALYPEARSFVYIFRDKDYRLGFSLDDHSEFDTNEASLYHWFITKVPGKLSDEE